MECEYNRHFYDAQFRKDRAFSKCNLSVIRLDLQLKAANMRPGIWGKASGYTQTKLFLHMQQKVIVSSFIAGTLSVMLKTVVGYICVPDVINLA